MLGFGDIAKIFEEIELRLIRSLKWNIGRHKQEEQQEGFEWSAWQAEKLRNINKFRRECSAIMNEYTDVIDSETRQLMEEQFMEGVNGAEVPDSDVQPKFFGVDDNKVTKLIDDVVNLEKHAETAALRTMDDVYRQTVHKAQLAQSVGGVSTQEAIDMAVRDFLDKGINCIVYRDGRRVNIADYVRMALRTTSTRAKLQGEAAKIKAMGYDTILVSSYSMCSDTCLPWQGRPYIDDVFSFWDGEIEERENGELWGKSNYCGKWFPLLSTAIHGGLFHPNCRHTISRYKDGDSLPKSIDNSEIEKRYKLEQKQRRLENEVRRVKRKAEGFSDPENVRKANRELREAQKKLREFINKVNEEESKLILKRDYDREKIYSGDSVDFSGESGIIEETSKKSVTPITDSSIERVPKVEISGYTDEQCGFIQKQHKELLEYSRRNNDNKEVAFVFNGDLTNRREFTGADDRLDFGTALYGKDLFVMHNHPRNSSYSLNDIVEFIGNDSIKTLTIVKNNGYIESLTKSGEYDRLSLLKELQRLEKNNIKIGSDSEYRKIVDKFLNKYSKGGFLQWLK